VTAQAWSDHRSSPAPGCGEFGQRKCRDWFATPSSAWPGKTPTCSGSRTSTTAHETATGRVGVEIRRKSRRRSAAARQWFRAAITSPPAVIVAQIICRKLRLQRGDVLQRIRKHLRELHRLSVTAFPFAHRQAAIELAIVGSRIPAWDAAVVSNPCRPGGWPGSSRKARADGGAEEGLPEIERIGENCGAR